MTAKNYYATLGVPPTASQQRIREAYHDLAKKHHPDKAGTESTGKFQDISEAYQVLSDPAARSCYDREQEPAGPDRMSGIRPGPRGWSKPEPLRQRHPVSESMRAGNWQREPDDFLDGILAQFLEGAIRQRQRNDGRLGFSGGCRELRAEIGVSPAEASCGAEIMVEVTWPAQISSFLRFGQTFLLRLHIPPGTVDGQIFHYPLDLPGGDRALLTVRIRLR